MATVTFPNGKSVNFQGTPTPQDIDYVASQIGIQPEQSIGQKALGVVGALGNAIVTPAETAGTHLAQLTGSVLDATGITKGKRASIDAKLADRGNKNLTGSDVTPLKPGVGGALQLAGDLGSVATSLYAPESQGILKMGALGATSGLSQSLAQGNTDVGKLTADTAAGGIFGGVLGGVSSALGHVSAGLKGATGVTPQIENELKNVSPNTVDQYFNASMGHENDVSVPSAFAVAEKTARDRASILTDKVIPQAGQTLDTLREQAGKSPVMLRPDGAPPVAGVDAVNTVIDSINNVMQKLTRHEFSSYSAGDTGIEIKNYPTGPTTNGLGLDEGGISPLPGRSVDLSNTEKKQLEYLSTQLQNLKENPTVATAMDVKTNINSEIGKWDNPQFGSSNSPVQGVMRFAYGQVGQLLHSVSPEIDAATTNYADLQRLKEAIGKEAGNSGQNASLMMRRVTSGDQSADVIPILNKLDQVTAPFRNPQDPSLVSHAVLSNWATKNFGGESGKTTLNQYTAEGSSMFGYARNAVNNVLKETFKFLTPDPVEFAKSIAASNPESMNLVTRIAQKVMNSSESAPLIGRVIKSLNEQGINPSLAGPIVWKLIKTAIFEKLTSPEK